MKVFARDEILTAEDVNENLNPAVAPNIPYAVAAGTLTPEATGDNVVHLTAYLPWGRFAVPPIVIATATGSSYAATANAYSTTEARVSVRSITGNGISGVSVSWVAIQMTDDAANG